VIDHISHHGRGIEAFASIHRLNHPYYIYIALPPHPPFSSTSKLYREMIMNDNIVKNNNNIIIIMWSLAVAVLAAAVP
jgi:wyosine [tRNA(Phe)-imidazoG37] synthetase (radical SAM superfamily)